jgi:hypothetical protein
MTGNSSVFDVCRTLPDRDGIDDLSSPFPLRINPDRAPQAPARA